jgi:hypothetical protein
MTEDLLPLGDDELRTLAELLARFATNHLDQWEVWRLRLAAGDVDVTIGPANEGRPTAQIWPVRA